MFHRVKATISTGVLPETPEGGNGKDARGRIRLQVRKRRLADLAEALDRDRFDMISELLALVSKFSAAGSLAADCGDVTEVAVRTRQVVLSTREACLVIGTLGRAETAP